MGAVSPRAGLFRKYVLLIVGLVSLVLLVNSAFDFWSGYEENKAALFRVQQEKAAAAAGRIEQFVDEIERQLGWTTALQWAASPLDQRRFDYVRLLRQVPAITELMQLDDTGREQLKVSRLAMDVAGSEKDYSQSPSFVEAKKHRIWFGPVNFRKESEPYMTGRRSTWPAWSRSSTIRRSSSSTAARARPASRPVSPLVALMRKLLTILNAMLGDRKPWAQGHT